MKRYLGWAVALLLSIGSFSAAVAADLPVKAPPIVAVEYNWTGIYGGINAGWIDDQYHWQYTNPSPVTCCAPFSASHDGLLLGGHVGAQYEFNHIVVGVEAAIMNGPDNLTKTVGCVAPNSLTIGCQIRRDTIITAGGRLGYAWDKWMVFGSGGWAGTTINTNLVNIAGPPFDPTWSRYDGWYAGFGFEYMLFKGPLADVIVGAEYQHIDFGTRLDRSSLDGFFPCPPGVNCRNVSATEDIARARVSFKWNPWATATPVVARY
jgi:outer membrane immunogenic protein